MPPLLGATLEAMETQIGGVVAFSLLQFLVSVVSMLIYIFIVVYIFMGGVKNSIVTDALQSLLTLALMIIILARVVPLGYDAGTHFIDEGTFLKVHFPSDER